MSRQLAGALTAAVIAGCQLPAEQAQVSDAPPVVTWNVVSMDAKALRQLADDGLSLRGDTTSEFRVSLRAADNVALSSVVLSVSGSFRCATAQGEWIAPYDVILDLPQQKFDGAGSLPTVAYLERSLSVLGTSCGHFPVPYDRRQHELFAVAGSFTVHARAEDVSGKVRESTMTIDASDFNPDHTLRIAGAL